MAWKFAEKARSLALLEAFRSSGAWNSSATADSLRAFAETYAAEKKKWHDLYTSTESEAERNDFLLKFMETDRKQELWLQTLEHVDSLFYKAKYDNQTVASEAVRAMLAPDEALLEYFIGDNSIFIFVFRADTFIIQEVKRDFPLEDWIEHLRQGLYGYYAPEKSELPMPLYEASVNKYGEFAQKIYQKIFAPVQDWLPEKVIVVPDGVLSYISFDALLTGVPLDVIDFKSYPYLLNRHQFSYSYSATLHREMREKQHRIAQEKELVAFAPFYPGNDSSSQRKTDETRQGFGPLYYTRMEVEQVQKWMGGEVFLQNDATESRFRETASRYRMIHLATHGVADNRVGDYAFLVFAKAKDSSGLDLLYVKDIYLLQLNADMVVLSACETGIGRLRRGEGMISLARAFAYAGAKSIITSLWSVNNKSTAELMSLFYIELHEGKPKDEALREARLRYFDKAAPRNLHPFFWAAFVPVGDMRPVR